MPRSAFVPVAAEYDWLSALLRRWGTLTFHLFQNNALVVPGSILGSFNEADYSGYSPQDAAFIDPTLTDSYAGVPEDKATSTPYVTIFPGNNGADQTVYGVYVTAVDPDLGTVLVFASNCFDVDPPAVLNGRTISGPFDTVGILSTLRLFDFFNSYEIATSFRFSVAGEVWPFNFVQASTYAITAEVVDGFGQPVVSYNGPAHVFSDDETAVYDNPVTITGGVANYNLQLNTTGTFSIGLAVFEGPRIVGGDTIDVIT